MKMLTEEDILNLTFPDASVTKFTLNFKIRKLEITTNISHVGGINTKTSGETSLSISD